MHWFTRISISRKWVTFLIAGAIMAGSIIATLQLKMELLPDIEFPYVVVFCEYPGHSPDQVMNSISIPVEEEIETMSGLRHVQSTSAEGGCFVYAEFDYGMNMGGVEEEIDRRLRTDPLLESLMDSEDLVVARMSLDVIPLVVITVSGANNGMTSAQVRQVAEELVDEVSVVDGLLKEETPFMKPVEIEGGNEDALVIPRVDDMNAVGVPVSWLVAALQGHADFESLQAVRETVLPDGHTVAQVADVVEPLPSSYTNGNVSVEVMWMKDPEANTVDVANAVISIVRDFDESHEAVLIDVVLDQSDYIESSINDLLVSAGIGVALAALVVLLFLWALGASLIITVSIPVSILVAMLLMEAFGITINIFTLGGLAVAVGRIVDNSIVSLENIYRHMQRGSPFREACIGGIKEVAMPITSATVATVAIFIPLMLVGGVVGEMFRPFSLTVTFALIASLVVALMLVPPLASYMGRGRVKFEGADNWYTRAYTRALKWSLGHRAVTLVIAIALFLVSIAILPMLGTSFLPSSGEKMLWVEIEMPYANDLVLTDKLKEVEDKVVELNAQDGQVEDYFAFLGSMMGEMSGGGEATIVVVLSDASDSEEQADTFREMCRPLAGDNTTIRVTGGSYTEQMMGSGGLEVWVVGEEDADLAVVEETTRTLTGKIRELEDEGRIENLESELATEKHDASRTWKPAAVAQYAELIGQTDMEMLVAQLDGEWINMRYGWPISQMGEQSPRVLINGTPTGITISGEVRSLPESQLGVIEDLRIGRDKPVKLSYLADVEFKSAAYNRADGGFAGTIEARIVAEDVGAVNREVQKMIDGMGEIPGIDKIEIGGVAEQMTEGFSDMFIAIVVAIVIAFVVMAISFRSWLTPVLIMVSLPLASIGAVLALLATGKPVGMSAMMGILMLVGIVLTNAIVFLTFVDDRRKEGYGAYDALVDAGRIRLRPILMTALTTMIALVPLAVGVGEGVLIAAELGVVVIGGLFSSTLLTLLVIPVLYSLTERFRKAPAGVAVPSTDEGVALDPIEGRNQDEQ